MRLALRAHRRRMRSVDGTRGLARHGAGALPSHLSCCRHARIHARMARPLGIFPVWFALSLPPATTFDSANLHNPKPNPSSASYTLPPSVLRQSAAPVAAPRPSPSPPHRPWRGSAMTRGSALTPVLVRARGVGVGLGFRSRVRVRLRVRVRIGVGVGARVLGSSEGWGWGWG